MKALFDMGMAYENAPAPAGFLFDVLQEGGLFPVWNEPAAAEFDFVVADRADAVDAWRAKGLWVFDMEGNPDVPAFGEKKLVAYDLDGTLADLNRFRWSDDPNEPAASFGRRNYMRTKPKNWPAFNAAIFLDAVHEETAFLFRLMRERADTTVIMVSAREGTLRKVTLDWLTKHDLLGFDRLFMRREKSFVDDAIEKKYLLDRVVEAYGKKPDMVVDDRLRVVRMWHENGIPVANVNQDRSEF